MTGSLVLLSGGMDSTALLARTVQLTTHRVETLSVNYGQRHARELLHAQAVADHFGVAHTVLDLSVLASHLTSALTGDEDVPHGHYAAENMNKTVVPNRNAIMLMAATGIAASRGLDTVLTAVHAGDHPIYPDCRPEFIDAASVCAQLGTKGLGDVSIIAPFVYRSKAEIVTVGTTYRAPFHLSWSCYEGGAMHCGRCGTCVERAEAFDVAGVEDPTTYADADYWRQVTA